MSFRYFKSLLKFLRSIFFVAAFFVGNCFAFDQGIHEKIQNSKNATLGHISVYGERFGGFVAPALGLFPYALFSLQASQGDSGKEFSPQLAMWRDATRAFAASTLVVWTGKTLVGRARPYLNDGAYTFRPFSFTDSNWNSFPSGHTASAFAMARVLSHWADNVAVSIFLYGSAGMTAYARMYEGKHWLSDVLIGGAIGYWVGEWSLAQGRKSEAKSGKEKSEQSSFYFFPKGLAKIENASFSVGYVRRF